MSAGPHAKLQSSRYHQASTKPEAPSSETPSNLTNHQVLAIAIINPPTDSISIPFPSAQQKQRQRAATGNMALNSFFNNKIEAMKLEIIERNSKLRRLEAQRNDYNSRGTTTLYDYAKLSIGYC